MEIANEVKILVCDFLHSRGLQLSEEKTVITHIDTGFDFLGWTFRKLKGKLLVKPSKGAIKNLIKKCSSILLKEGKASTQDEIIRRLNPIIKGWTNYHRHTVASHAFSYINNTLYLLLCRWAKHRHPNKNAWWRLNKYWHPNGNKPWVFMTKDNTLINLRTIPIVRHPNLQLSMNPFLNQDYFQKRKRRLQLLNAA